MQYISNHFNQQCSINKMHCGCYTFALVWVPHSQSPRLYLSVLLLKPTSRKLWVGFWWILVKELELSSDLLYWNFIKKSCSAIITFCRNCVCCQRLWPLRSALFIISLRGSWKWKKKKKENCTILIKAKIILSPQEQCQGLRFRVSSQGLSTEIDIIIWSPIQVLTEASVA